MFKIKLTDEHVNRGMGSGIDPVSAAMELNAANEELNVASLQHSILVTAIENIEDGAALAEAIAAKGDSNAGVVVARESLRQNLKMIGQEALVSSVVSAGTESVEVANEGIADMAKKAWAKAKEFMLKIWDFVVSLTRKVVQFVASLFGKGATTSERLKKLIKSLKDSRRKELDGEFTEAQRKAICKKFAVLAAGKDGVNVNSITKKADDISSKFGTITADTFLTDLSKNTDGNAGLTDLITSDKKELSVFITTLKGLKKATRSIKFEQKVYNPDFAEEKDNEVSKLVKEKFTDEFDASKYNIFLLSSTFTKQICVALYEDSDSDAASELDGALDALDGSETDISKINTAINKSLSYLRSLKVAQFTVAPEESDYEDHEKDIYPLSFSDLETLEAKFKAVEKNVKPKLEKFEKNIDKKAKDTKKTIEDNVKGASIDVSSITGNDAAAKQEAATAAGTRVKEGIGSIIKLILEKETKLAKAVAQAAVDMAKDITAGPVYDYAEMSSKYYKKG